MGLAGLSLSKKNKRLNQKRFPQNLKQFMEHLDCIPVTSVPLEVDPSGIYENIPTIATFGDTIMFAGEEKQGQVEKRR